MNAYYNVPDFVHALKICKSYKRNPKGNYSIHDQILARQYASEFMKEIWNIVKKCEVSLKEAFSLIRWNTAAITTKTLETLKSWLKPIKSLSPKAISQSLRAERQQARQNEASDLTMRVRVKRFWDRHESRFHRQNIITPLPLTESEIKALKPW